MVSDKPGAIHCELGGELNNRFKEGSKLEYIQNINFNQLIVSNKIIATIF